jgi:hypothetical protein
MRKLVAFLLVLSLTLGLASAAFAKDYTLDIYWIANKDDEEIRKGVEEAVSEYVEPLIKAKVAFHLVTWDPEWTNVAIKALMDDEKIVMDIVEEFGEEKFDTLCTLFEELKTLMRKKLKKDKR